MNYYCMSENSYIVRRISVILQYELFVPRSIFQFLVPISIEKKLHRLVQSEVS